MGYEVSCCVMDYDCDEKLKIIRSRRENMSWSIRSLTVTLMVMNLMMLKSVVIWGCMGLVWTCYMVIWSRVMVIWSRVMVV